MEKQYKLRNGPGPAEFRQKLNIIMVLVCLALTVLTIRLWHFELKPPSGGLSMPGAQPSRHGLSC